MKTIIHMIKFICNINYRTEVRKQKLGWCKKQINIISKEIPDIKKILETVPGAHTSLREDLKHNYSLLGYYKNETKNLNKKLKINN